MRIAPAGDEVADPTWVAAGLGLAYAVAYGVGVLVSFRRLRRTLPDLDPHIPEGSALPGATNIELDAGGHFRILADPRVIAEATRLAH